MQHVDAVCRKCNYHLIRIRSIRTYITKHVCHSTCCFMLSLLQRSTAGPTRMSHNASPENTQQSTPPGYSHTCIFSHMTPVLEQLHWLPVRQRVVFKVLVFIYKALHDLASEYLSPLLHPRTRNPRLRQLYDKRQLAVTPASKSIGRRVLGVTGPIIWNELPLTLRDAPSLALFKSHLKTFI